MRKHKKKIKKKKQSVLQKLHSFVKHPFIRKNEPMLHTFEWIFILFAFFAVGFPIIYFKSGQNMFEEGQLQYIGGREIAAPLPEVQKEFIGETIEEPVADITGWDTYRNQWYGFEIKHPDSWTNMSFKSAAGKNSRYETVYKFRKDVAGGNDTYIGFDVAVYMTKKAGSPESTNEMQKINISSADVGNCQFSEEMSLGENNNKFQKVSVNKNDACFEPTYFFSITKGDYIYDIIPVAKEGSDTPENIEQDVNQKFPEYKQVVASFENIPVTRATSPVVSKPIITASRPVAGTKIGSEIVCSAKHDHPSKSNKGKGKHMDEDCCPDPDEYPNPWCTYSGSQLSVMISSPKKS